MQGSLVFILDEQGKNRDDLDILEKLSNMKLTESHKVINLNNDFKILYEYEEMILMTNGYFKVKKDGMYGIIDKKGNTIVPCEHTTLYLDNSGNYIGEANNKEHKYGHETYDGCLIHSSGKIMMPYLENRQIKPTDYKNAYIVYLLNDKTYHSDKEGIFIAKGNELIEAVPIQRDAKVFVSGFNDGIYNVTVITCEINKIFIDKIGRTSTSRKELINLNKQESNNYNEGLGMINAQRKVSESRPKKVKTI